MRVLAVAAVATLVYAGFIYLTSRGEQDKLKTAKTAAGLAVVGLLIALFSVLIVNFILKTLQVNVEGVGGGVENIQ